LKVLVLGKDTFAGRNFVENVKDFEVLTEPKEKADAIINFQALIEAPYSLRCPKKVFDVNVKPMLEFLELARKWDAHFIQPSSNLVYGNPIYTPIDELHPLQPQSPYAATRVCQEALAMSYHHSYDLPVTILRFSNLYGPYGKGVINIFIRNALTGKPLIIKGGTQTRTFTHIYDAVKAIRLALKSKKAIGEIFNIAGPDTISIDDLLGIIRSYFAFVEFWRTDFDKGDITSPKFEISYEKAKKFLGYEPEYDIIKGIEQVVRFESERGEHM